MKSQIHPWKNFKRTSTTERKEEIDTKVEFNNHIEIMKNQYEWLEIKSTGCWTKKIRKLLQQNGSRGNRIQGLKTREINWVFR